MKAWKESASLILAARHTQKYIRPSLPSNFQYDYNLLCLKRHQNSKFMPSTYVFPGGVVHPSDADLKWHNLFSAFGFDVNSFSSLTPNTSVRPSIFKSRPNELPKEISLRITAIRETFEECGVLICKQSKESTDNFGWAQHVKISENELGRWQTKVHNDATEFYSLCENFNCYPDLWALYEWSNWLTPTYYTGRRFDTVFYLACLPNNVNSAIEATEIEDSKWDQPGGYIFSNSDIVLPPPQQYEIARIAKFESIDNLLDFAIDRSKMGVLLNLPVKVELQDGKVHVLPGDSMYPSKVNLVDEQVIDRRNITIREFRDMSAVKNRMEFFNLQVTELFVQNFDSIDGHLSPIQLRNVYVTSLNKKSTS
ncbi:acyl-coenzyme A diphosphatase NUDT19 isoform X1 [Megachile rotundata]|uniref:acyl-coenzyme A diphosphatase NUDT19 isoform X1 n=1 Tax=Megachile rotundata TaxID=143995 RepID=UPI000614CB38|nr:PREDICTED: nucleoside diphosphate-linked moiety X motif 19, mitochondrial-like isoform X1 [Megachile rotundata]XP_012142753.1 PREDICTED: nucleoside diphosphate-linked moiety X motif 19, mitochondrial-like isoform X1 [Megachile rotundata]